MGREPDLLGVMLGDEQFSNRIPRRILVRMKFVKDLVSYGAHEIEFHTQDALTAVENLLSVLRWCTTVHDLRVSSIERAARGEETIEILPQLRSKYRRQLRPDIYSVKLGQSEDKCYLEITSRADRGPGVFDEKITRTDLEFIRDGDEALSFDPQNDLEENTRKFLDEFSEISIINCTELFTAEAAAAIDEYDKQQRSEDSSD